MRSIYEQALGSDFGRLHPRMQERFGFSSRDGVASIGRGIMRRVWHGSPLVKPFLWVGALRNIMFPETGTDVPFAVDNYAFSDHLGREVVSWVRTFRFPGVERRFDAYMALAPDGKTVVDYFGTHAHYSTDLHLYVTEEGGLGITSGAHRFHLGRLRLPFPEWLAGRANVVEWYDDELGSYRIRVRVTNPVIGLVLAYDGEFQAAWETVRAVPERVMPVRPLPV